MHIHGPLDDIFRVYDKSLHHSNQVFFVKSRIRKYMHFVLCLIATLQICLDFFILKMMRAPPVSHVIP